MYTKLSHNNVIANSLRLMGFVANATSDVVTVSLSRRRIEISEVITALDAVFPGVGFQVSRKSEREVVIK